MKRIADKRSDRTSAFIAVVGDRVGVAVVLVLVGDLDRVFVEHRPGVRTEVGATSRLLNGRRSHT